MIMSSESIMVTIHTICEENTNATLECEHNGNNYNYRTVYHTQLVDHNQGIRGNDYHRTSGYGGRRGGRKGGRSRVF